MAGSFVLQNSTLFGIFSQLYQLDLHGMDESYLETFVEKVHAVTPAEVQRIAQTYLRLDELVIVAVGDRAVIDAQLKPFGEVTIASED
jgi:predicted Zn-dependent peptidase